MVQAKRLQQGAGKMPPLKQKGNFRRLPHLERTGRRTLICAAVVLAVLVIWKAVGLMG